jgi:hypothetical protein
MKALFATTAIAVAIALAGPASAQLYGQPMGPAPAPMQTMQPPMQTMPPQMQTPYQPVASAPWTQDDGSSSDHPIHNPGDVSGDRLNAQYQGGLDVPPSNGFPAPYRVR